MKRQFRLSILLVLLGFSAISFGLFIPSAFSWTPLEGHIIQDTTLMFANSPYRVVNNVTVDAGVKLTIEPGVTVEFDDGLSLIIQGSLNATGTGANPIVFTSSSVSPIAGAWNTIDFTGALNCSFVLEHVKVGYAVNGITVESQGPATIARSVLSNCSQSGIMIKGKSNIAIVENTIEHNTNGIATDPHTQGTQEGIVIAGNVISFNTQNGIYFATYWASSPIHNISFSSNTVSFNGLNGIYIGIPASTAPDFTPIYNINFSSNTVSSNGLNGIYIYAYSYYQSSLYGVSFSSNNVSFNNGNGIYLHSYSSPIRSVSFSSNNVSSNNGNGIYLYTDYSPIYSVSLSSNTVSSNNGTGIYLETYSYWDSPIHSVNLSSNNVSSNKGNGICIYTLHSPIYGVSLSSNTVSSNGLNGIYVFGHRQPSVAFDVTATNNTVTKNWQRGIYIANTLGFGWNGQQDGVRSNLTQNSILNNYHCGVWYQAIAGNLATRNDIYSNGFGMTVTEGASVNATYNYWGDRTGPYQLFVNPEGKGNPVGGNGVDLEFIPWLTTSNGSINERPFAKLTADKTSISSGQMVTFDASTSTDDGRVDKYFFNFGDNKNSTWTTLSVVKHNYTSAGVYPANLTVMDDFGVVSNNIANQTITVTQQQLPTLTVTLTLNPTVVNSGENVSVQVHVTNGTLATRDASVQLISDKGGTFTAQSGYTNSNGDFTATFTAPTVSTQTNVRITATASKAGYNNDSDYEYVTVLLPEQQPPTLSVAATANPTTIQSSQTSTITIRVTFGSNPIADATVTLSSNNGGTLSTTSGNTDSNGYLTVTYTAPTVTAQTTISITVNATKTGYLNDQGQTQITVNPSPPPSLPLQPDLTLWIYVAIVAIVLAGLGGGLAIASRKSHKRTQEPTSPPNLTQTRGID